MKIILSNSFFVIFSAFLLTIIPEFLLVERRYSLFQGGFGQSHELGTIGEVLTFFAALLFLHIAAVFVIYWISNKVLHNTIGRLFFHYNFLFTTIFSAAIYFSVKYKILSYFSDNISFRLIKRLGGGSLSDAFLYVIDESTLIFVSFTATILLYCFGLWILRNNRGLVSAHTDPAQPSRKKSIAFAFFAIILPLMLYFVNDTKNVRYALDRFSAFGIFNRALAEITDFDRDGFSYFSVLKDDFPFDSTRHPLALDVPGNGIDEDGFAGDYIYLGRANWTQAQFKGRKKNLVLIVLESTRGDSLSKTIDGIEITPNINELAKAGISIDQAYSHVGFTSPSLMSLFSGSLYATSTSRSLFRDLKGNGYKVAVFSGQPETFGDISQTVGMEESADIFADAELLKQERAFGFAVKSSLVVDGQVLLREFDQRLGDAHKWDTPTFVYFNFQAAHFPYYHKGMKLILPINPIPRGKINEENREWLRKTYWNAVAYGDWLVGQVISRLKKLGVYQNTLVVVTADHGESLFDDGFLGHGHALNIQQTHIPLVFNKPGVVVTEPVGLKDYYDLIMELLGADAVDKNAKLENKKKTVFQFIGPLDEPRSIGLVEDGQKWTILDLHTQVVSITDMSQFVHYQDLSEYPVLKERSDRLVFEWERQRWQKHLDDNAVDAKKVRN